MDSPLEEIVVPNRQFNVLQVCDTGGGIRRAGDLDHQGALWRTARRRNSRLHGFPLSVGRSIQSHRGERLRGIEGRVVIRGTSNRTAGSGNIPDDRATR